MAISRRNFVAAASAASLTGLFGIREVEADQKTRKRPRLGIGSSSYSLHNRANRRKNGMFTDPLQFLNYCKSRDAGGIQTGLGKRGNAYAKKFRGRAEQSGMFIEASIGLPRNQGDVSRFDAEVRFAKTCGVTIVRTVMLGGRRYETFKSLAEFQRFRKQSLMRLQLAEPVAARHKIVLAVENHKDFRSEEFVELLKKIDSSHVGVCVDTGNNIALLEDVTETTKRLAPFAVSCHLKDMAVEEYADGFLLSGVPLGTGNVDLKTIVTILRKQRPEINFCLEMITRDPLRIPCLTDEYWKTFPKLPAKHLASMLRWVRAHNSEKPLPRISRLSPVDQLKSEEANVIASLQFAKNKLEL
jgi:3-oxoisoapionate decarboxylase